MALWLCWALLSILLVLAITQEGGATCICPASNGCPQSPSTGSCHVSVSSSSSYQSSYYTTVYSSQTYTTRCGWLNWAVCSPTRQRSTIQLNYGTYYRTVYSCRLHCCSGYKRVEGACVSVCNPPCANGGTCVSPDTCACRPEWRGPTCEQDLNECATGNGGCAHTCNNTIGSYYCSCDPGYRLGDNRRRCHNIDECAENSDGCEQMCTDTDGSFECSCGDGFSVSSDGKSCDDNDECTNNTSGCDQNCNNTVGGYFCDCEDGFLLSSDNHTCDAKPQVVQEHIGIADIIAIIAASVAFSIATGLVVCALVAFIMKQRARNLRQKAVATPEDHGGDDDDDDDDDDGVPPAKDNAKLLQNTI